MAEGGQEAPPLHRDIVALRTTTITSPSVERLIQTTGNLQVSVDSFTDCTDQLPTVSTPAETPVIPTEPQFKDNKPTITQSCMYVCIYLILHI